jgi:hypothetical protein
MASDATGLLYAVHTFVQIIQLHSDFTTSSDFSVNRILIPPMKIIDWPDIPNRGVVWSYRNTARSTSSSMKLLVRLFSSLRINQLFLTIDTLNSDSADQLSTETIQSICSKVCSLDEISKRHCVDLIPVVTISHVNDRFCEIPFSLPHNSLDFTLTSQETSPLKPSRLCSISKLLDHLITTVLNSQLIGLTNAMMSSNKLSVLVIATSYWCAMSSPMTSQEPSRYKSHLLS